MKTLELKDLKYYLGTELKGIVADDGIIRELYCLYEYTLKVNPSKHGFTHCIYENFKPILLPLSSLTEPLPDGSIPIVELAKIMYPNHSEWRLSASGHYAVIRNGYMTFEFDSGNNCFLINNCGIMDQLKCYEYLYQHHFWLGDQSLFETGEVIDKRILKL